MRHIKDLRRLLEVGPIAKQVVHAWLSLSAELFGMDGRMCAPKLAAPVLCRLTQSEQLHSFMLAGS